VTLGDVFFFVVLPYAAVGQLIPATLYRARKMGSLQEPLAGPLLTGERRAFASSAAWIGAMAMALLHLLPLFAPPLWRALIASQMRLLIVELLGLAGGVSFLAGTALLLWRRNRAAASPLTASLELAALAAIVLSAGAGVVTALTSRWGAAWYSRALVPYLFSLLKLAPDVTAISALGFWPRLHVACGFVALALAPFTTLPGQLRAALHLAPAPRAPAEVAP